MLEFIANGLYDLLARGKAAIGLDSKRPRSWDEYGYPQDVTFEQLYLMFKRGGLAAGAVGQVVERCWSEDPYLLDGTLDADNAPESQAEQQMRRYATAIGMWQAYRQADMMRMVGGVSALLLEAPGKWSEPIRRGSVTGVKAVWRNQIRPKEREPVTERVTLWQHLGTRNRITDVHPDRIFLLGDWDDPQSFIEPAYNALLNIDKVCGGAGEGFLKNAARQLALKFPEGSNLQQIATSLGKKPEELQGVLDDMAKDFNRGIDSLFTMAGGELTPVVASMPDAVGPFEINLQVAAAAWRIPLKILVGNQTGERASTEDVRAFNAMCQARNVTLVYPEVARLFEHLARIRAVPALPAEYSVGGPDLTEATKAEKLANAKILADINKLAEVQGGDVFSTEEVRTAAGYTAQ